MSKPFSNDEMVVKSTTTGFGGMVTEFFDSPITSKENILRLYQGKTPLWIPAFSEMVNIMIDCDPENMARGSKEGGVDGFGVPWVWGELAGGAMVKPGNPICPDINEWEKYVKIPDPDSWDWEGCYERTKAQITPDKLVCVSTSSMLFERLIAILDFDNAAVALIDDDEKEAVHRFFRAVTDYRKRFYELAYKWFKPEVMNFNDDWGSQRAEFFSVDTAKEMLVPYAKELGDKVHELGCYFDLHCCGFVENFVPLFIEEGFNSWGGQPLNDKLKLKNMYGDKMVFSQELAPLAPDASEEEIDKAVADFMAGIGADNRVFYQNFTPDLRVRRAMYIASRKNYDKLLAEGKVIDPI